MSADTDALGRDLNVALDRLIRRGWQHVCTSA